MSSGPPMPSLRNMVPQTMAKMGSVVRMSVASAAGTALMASVSRDMVKAVVTRPVQSSAAASCGCALSMSTRACPSQGRQPPRLSQPSQANAARNVPNSWLKASSGANFGNFIMPSSRSTKPMPKRMGCRSPTTSAMAEPPPAALPKLVSTSRPRSTSRKPRAARSGKTSLNSRKQRPAAALSTPSTCRGAAARRRTSRS
mmetsp:Transcript_8557/g.24723  ORF Transcript_8557/g.24723 Transcript_8557/m.24723 type:complete len:200 (+) Transcript_8557:1757-2356(+)